MSPAREFAPRNAAARARRRRSDAGEPRCSGRDLELLSIVGEQYALSLPHLARLMGRSLHAARWLRSRWERAGWAKGRAVVVGEPVFVWLTRRGQRIASSEYSLWRPNRGRWRTSPRSPTCGSGSPSAIRRRTGCANGSFLGR